MAQLAVEQEALESVWTRTLDHRGNRAQLNWICHLTCELTGRTADWTELSVVRTGDTWT